MDIKLYDGDNGEKYVLYEDVINMIDKLREVKKEQDKIKDNEIKRLNKTINTALHRLRAGNRHYKTVQENNAIIYTIRILEEGLENGSCSDIRK